MRESESPEGQEETVDLRRKYSCKRGKRASLSGAFTGKFLFSFVCHVCTHVSYSYQSHCLHLFKAHKIKNQLSRFVNKTSCPVCLKEFHNRERALNHFKYRAKTTCTPYLIKRGPVLTEKQARKLDEQEKENNNKLHAAGKRRHHASIPCWKFSGPRIPINIFCQLYQAPVDTDTEDE